MKLQKKPFQILELLLQTPGEFVTRQRLAQHLWPSLHVAFDRSLNTAVNTLREALGDSSQNPHFIETRSGLGYRFIAPVEIKDEVVNGRSHTGNHKLEAYQDYLKGRYFCNKMTEDDLRKGIAHFEAALALNPEYAPAFAGLADAYSLFAFLSLIPPKVACPLVKKYALAALRIDSQLADAHASLASVKKLYEWDWEGAEAEYRRALALKPGYADGHRWYAALLAATGRAEDSLDEINTAQELEPLSLVINMEVAWNLYMARDFESSIEQSWKTLTMEPRFAPAQHTLGLAYEQVGMHEEAVVEFENAYACSSGHPAAVATLGHGYAKAGRPRDALARLDELEKLSLERYVSPYWFGVLHAGLADAARAFESLERARDERDVWLVWAKVEPRFDALRDHPRFDKLLESIGFP